MKLGVLILVLGFCLPGLQASEPSKVLIVGAGLSGLSTAYFLKKRNMAYQILEYQPQVGGRVQTAHYEIPGYPPIYADSGMEEYWESNPGVRILRELGLELRSDVSVSSIRLLGKVYSAAGKSPDAFLRSVFTHGERAQLESLKKKAKVISDAVHKAHSVPNRYESLVQKSFADWVEEQKVPKKVSEWIRISVECEIGTDWDRISAIDGIAELHIFFGEGEKSVRVVGGNERFVQKLVEAVGSENILTHRKVTQIQTRGSEVLVSAFNTETHKAESYRANHVVATMPIFRFPMEIQKEPALSHAKLEAISSLGWGNYFKAHVIVKPGTEKRWTENGASLLPLLTDSELGVVYDGNPDQTSGPRVLSFLTFGDHAEGFNMMPQDLSRAHIRAALEKLFPGVGADILEIHFYRYHPRAIAAWPVGRSRFDSVSRLLRAPEARVYFAGDFTESSHSDGAFLSAERVVSQILESETEKESEKVSHGK